MSSPDLAHRGFSLCSTSFILHNKNNTIKTFHLQVITHINRQKEENITDVQTYSPGHKSILTPPTFVLGGWWWGGNCHTEPVSEQQEPMHKERARAKGPLQPPRVWSGDGGGTKGPLLCECRRPCCLPSSAPPSNTSLTASSLLAMLAAILQPHEGVGFLSPKESRRNSSAPPGRPCRRSGSPCIGGHTLTRPPRSAPSP